MHPRRLEYEEAGQAYADQMKEQPDVIGIILAGSWLHDPIDPNADIDVVVILDPQSDYRERGNTWINGIEIEYFMNPVQQLSAYFQQETKSPHTAHMLATGRVVYQASSLVAELVEEAKQIWTTPPPALSNVERDLKRYFLDDLRKDFADALSNKDQLGTQLLRHQLINQSIDLCCRIHRLWRDKHKRLQAQLTKADPTFAALIQAALFEQADQQEALFHLLSYTEQWTSGPRPREWQLKGPLAL